MYWVRIYVVISSIVSNNIYERLYALTDHVPNFKFLKFCSLLFMNQHEKKSINVVIFWLIVEGCKTPSIYKYV